MSDGLRRADLFVDPAEDPRDGGPSLGDERATLAEWLRGLRLTVQLKCDGLGAAELARRSVEPSTLSLLGLVRHLADVERHWFRHVLAGEEAPPRFHSASAPDGAFDGAAGDPALVAEAWAAWEDERAFADRYLASEPDLGQVVADERNGEVSVREVLVHLVAEYARHAGHADLLRERIDGRIGA